MTIVLLCICLFLVGGIAGYRLFKDKQLPPKQDPVIIEKMIVGHVTTPSYYLTEKMALRASIADKALLESQREVLVRLPPTQEAAKYALLGAAQDMKTENVFVEFDASKGDYLLCQPKGN